MGREVLVGHLPEDVSVDDANVQQPPEDVFPPPIARTSHTVICTKLVQAVDPAHQSVVSLDAGGHW